MNKDQEIGTITLMVRRYCRSVHETGGRSLRTKRPLPEHVKTRQGICPHGDNKPVCSICRIHCYKPEMRQQLRAVMRYAGPRICCAIWRKPCEGKGETPMPDQPLLRLLSEDKRYVCRAVAWMLTGSLSSIGFMVCLC